MRGDDGRVDVRAQAKRTPARIGAWLLATVVLGGLIAAWATTLTGVVADRPPIAQATSDPTFGAREVIVSGPRVGPNLTEGPKCIYGQTTQGSLVVISAQTGSLLTEAQAANCAK
jgi:hypothetical protein